MIEAFWIPLLPPYLIGLGLSWAIETLLTPRPVAPWRRPGAAVAVHVGVWTLAFALELALFRRPYFAVANVLAIELLIVLVSNAKYQALREPFVYPDFEYFLDAIKHPRLYLPFFGIWRSLAAGGGYGVTLWAGLAFEDSVTAGVSIWLTSFLQLQNEYIFDPVASAAIFYLQTIVLALVGVGIALCFSKRISISFSESRDIKFFGLVASLAAYRHHERVPSSDLTKLAPFQKMPQMRIPDRLREMPDLVAVQSESFFDARREYPILRQDLLENLDHLRLESRCFGPLQVPAWGANTVRTEFAFLSGIPPDKLGVHKYNPYRRIIKEEFPTIASCLRNLGYRTVCVHPYHAGFYRRDSVIPKLGFEEFVDISAFARSDYAGSYVSDTALGEYVKALLQSERDDRPLYIHVITMENHGPLHLEEICNADVATTLSQPMPPGCEDLVAYARHLKSTDSMIKTVRQALVSQTRPGGFCFFGDHVPIMKNVYRSLHEPEGTTDYVIWTSNQRPYKHKQLSVHDLAHTFLTAAFSRNI